MIEVWQFRNVAANTDNIFSELLRGVIEFGLTAASNEDKGAFGDKPFGGGEAQATGSSGDEGNLISEFHQVELLS